MAEQTKPREFLTPVVEESYQKSLLEKWIPYSPLGIGLLSIGINLFCYPMAFYNHQVEPIFPYVSDAATHPTQAPFFGIALTVIGVGVGFGAFFRNKQVKVLFTRTAPDYAVSPEMITLVRCLNISTSLSAAYVVVCVILVAQFRATEWPLTHVVLASILFGSETFMMLFDAWISLLTVPHMTSRPVALIRLLIYYAVFDFFLLTSICGAVSMVKFEKNFNSADRLWWNKQNGGYYWHLASSVTECSLITSTGFYFFTFISDIRRGEIVRGKVKFYPRKNWNTAAEPITFFGLLGPKGLFGWLNVKCIQLMQLD